MTPRGSGTTSTEEGRDPYAGLRARMVEEQLRRRGIESERVLDAMRAVPREVFVPPELRSRAYDDGALPIGEGQTLSQPVIVARMTALLELRGDETVLEVGTGSGYGAAVLSRCCRDVITIERRGVLASAAVRRLRALGYANVEVRVGDGALGAPDRAPFGGISVTAAASGAPPAALLDQLAPGAALVCPIERGDREVLVRVRNGVVETIASVRFVPLLRGTE